MLTAKDKQALLEHAVSPVQDSLKQQLWDFCLLNLFAETFFQSKGSLSAIKVSSATVKFLSLMTSSTYIKHQCLECKADNVHHRSISLLTRVSELGHLYKRCSSTCLMQHIYIPPIPLCASPSSAFVSWIASTNSRMAPITLFVQIKYRLGQLSDTYLDHNLKEWVLIGALINSLVSSS